MSAPRFETQFLCQSEDSRESTVYRLISNPDAPSNTFANGATLVWEDPEDGWESHGHFFVPPDLLRAFADMFSAAAEIHEANQN
jgi:hypothetical protein